MKTNRYFILLASLLFAACTTETIPESSVKNLYEIDVAKASGETVTLDAYSDNVLLIVNTASKCGFTRQYDGLQKLYETYKEQGFIVLGFPSNDFLSQEPGSNEEIQSFCKLNYGVTFPVFAKLSVKGGGQHPLYQFLTSKTMNPQFGGKISWNFNKFLISKKGNVVARFGSRTKPEDEKLIQSIEAELKK